MTVFFQYCPDIRTGYLGRFETLVIGQSIQKWEE
jgi:hypothetical protein